MQVVPGKTSLTTRVQSRIRRLRAEQGMTQEMLCQAAGISLDAVSRIENGTRAPTLETVEKLARGLGVPVAHLLGGGSTPRAPQLPPRVMRLAHALASSDEHVQRTAERVVRLLIGVTQRPKPRK